MPFDSGLVCIDFSKIREFTHIFFENQWSRVNTSAGPYRLLLGFCIRFSFITLWNTLDVLFWILFWNIEVKKWEVSKIVVKSTRSFEKNFSLLRLRCHHPIYVKCGRGLPLYPVSYVNLFTKKVSISCIFAESCSVIMTILEKIHRIETKMHIWSVSHVDNELVQFKWSILFRRKGKKS